MSTKPLLIEVTKRLSLDRGSRVAVWGSNYPMFEKSLDPDCSKCLGGFDLKEPRNVDRLTFDLSLALADILSRANVFNHVIFLPSDLVKGMGPGDIAQYRINYSPPRPFVDILSGYGRTPIFVNMLDPKNKTQILNGQNDAALLFAFEGEFRRRALSFYKDQIRTGRIRGISLRRTQKEDRLIVEASGFGPYLGIPIASEGVEGHTTTTVFCQLILSRILKHLQSLGFTHLVGFFGSSEQLCANQGTTIAYHCGLNLQTNLLFFREKDAENFSLTSFDIYPR